MSASSSSESFDTSLSSRKYSPLVGVSRHPRMCISVDLPEPEGPITATNSPSLILNDAPLRACVSMPPDWYILVTFLHSIIYSYVHLPPPLKPPPPPPERPGILIAEFCEVVCVACSPD